MIQEKFSRWLQLATEDEDIKQELKSLIESNDQQKIKDLFYRELEFGTGGLRGIIGAGTNRMNIYTVRKATQGLSNYIKKSALPLKVAIAYDSRHKGKIFAQQTAQVLAGNGITAWIYPRLEPTPALSWAVRYLGCGAGVCITASHNPAEYNGYKVYGQDGCQITLTTAQSILEQINLVDCFDDVKMVDFQQGLDQKQICWIPERCLEKYLDEVCHQQVGSGEGIDTLKLIYTPLNGSGMECVSKLLDRMGVIHCTVVPQQEQPDGSFPTCPYPNPEIHQAMEKGLELCEELKPDLLIGTDPDCDRCGIAVPNGIGGYQLVTGNEMGILLLDYICHMRQVQGTMPKYPVAVTTIVSTDMAEPICRQYGVELRRTLTGFKFIGEQIGELEKQGQIQRYIFGFEESYGYLSGTYVRDKDGVNAVLLICEAAAWYAHKGKTLLDAMKDLYAMYGWYQNRLLSFTFEGEEGMYKMKRLMERLRCQPPKVIAGRIVERIVDFYTEDTGLPKANVIEIQLERKGKVIIRPSGTEPKIKAYLSTVEISQQAGRESIAQLEVAVQQLLKS